MSRLLVVLVSGLLLVPSAAAVAQRQYPATAAIRGENIWLRVEPAEDTEALAYLQRGDQIRVTGDSTAADGDTFSPIEVVETGETGWVRELAVDPRTFAAVATVPEVDVEAAPVADATAGDTRPRRTRTPRERPGTDTSAIGEPTRTPRAKRTATPKNDGGIEISRGDPTKLDCEDFDTQAEAQDYFDAQGWTATNDPEGLDATNRDDDGIPCESLP